MIPILFSSAETAFTSNGLGRLSECISCTVTEERNGIFELEMQYPVDGKHYDQLISGGIIGAWHDDKHDLQPFDVYKWTAPIDGIVTFYAHHISYRLSRIVLEPYSATSAAEALTLIPSKAANACPFTFWTDKNVAGDFELTKPDNARAILGGQTGSILDVFGKGEYEFDKFLVRLYVNRGVNNNVTIRYGKNLSSLTDETDSSGIFNAVAPFWAGSSGDEQTVVYLPEIFVKSPDVTGAALPAVVDFSSDFQEQPTEADLRQRALTYLAANEPWKQTHNVKVSFVQLWQTPEYENVAALQRLSLCDKVNIYYPKLGVIAEESEIIKVVYNVLLERFDSMEIGTPQTTLAQALSQGVQQQIDALAQIVNGKPDDSAIQAAIDNATSLITGGLGGYVVFTLNAAGQPQEILVMDTDNINTAVHVIRINQNGIGFSSTGYQGPFTSAWTIDGSFVADFITSGTLNANVIRTGLITDTQGISSWNLTSGVFSTVEATIGPFHLDHTGFTYNKDNPTGAQASLTYLGVMFKGAGVSSYSRLGQGGFELFGQVHTIGDTNLSALAITSFGGALLNNILIPTADIDYQLNSPSSPFVRFFRPDDSQGKRVVFYSPVEFAGGMTVTAGQTKNKVIPCGDYGKRKLYCYETASPLFGDVGEGILDAAGLCYVFLDAVFAETIATDQYQVFLQPYGEGACFVSEREPGYFVVKGAAGLSFGWELKAKQIDVENVRLEDSGMSAFPYSENYGNLAADYFEELEEGRI